MRDDIPAMRDLAAAESATLRLRLLKIAVRVVETVSRVRLAFGGACPEADLIRSVASTFNRGGPVTDGAVPLSPIPILQRVHQ